MEHLSAKLQPYKSLVGTTASIVTIGQFFSGMPIVYDIHKRKSTKGKSATPFVGGCIMGMLILKYALILQDKAMFQVNIAAILLNFLYTLCYTHYATNKWEEVYKQLSFGLALVVGIFAYISVESPERLEFRYGLLITILSLMLLGSPLVEMQDMIARQDASAIQFPLVFMSTWVSLLWFIYGLILLNIFMVVQNIIGLVLCIIQLVLLFLYPGNSGTRSKKKK